MEPSPARTVKMLARHSVMATFDGVEDRPCRFLTSLCPNQCGHGNRWAIFTIDEYLAWEKPGQYGDEKQPKFHVQMNPIDKRVDHVEGMYDLLREMTPGTRVKIEWLHEYVSDQGANYPIRRVTHISRV